MAAGAIILSGFGLFACGAEASTSDYNQPTEVDEFDGNLKRVDVDGIDCIVYDSAGAGGLSCNWPVGDFNETGTN